MQFDFFARIICICRKNTVVLRQNLKQNAMQSVEDKILTSLKKSGRGVAFAPIRFAHLGTASAVQKALQKGGIDVGEETPIPNDSMESIKQKKLQTND